MMPLVSGRKILASTPVHWTTGFPMNGEVAGVRGVKFDLDGGGTVWLVEFVGAILPWSGYVNATRP